jgi:phage I-like protein
MLLDAVAAGFGSQRLLRRRNAMRQTSRYCTARFIAAVGELAEGSTRSRVHAVPWGRTKLKDARIRACYGEPGEVLLDERSSELVPEYFGRRENDYHINADHEWGPAFGWIRGVEVVEGDALYLDVEWNDEGVAMINGKRYAYFSLEPLLEVIESAIDDDTVPDVGRVVAVTGGALTNRPAVGGLRPVELSQLPPELGLGGSGTTGEPPRKERDMSEKSGLMESLRRILPGGSSVVNETDAAVEVARLREQAGQVAKLAERVTELETAQAELTTNLATKTTEADGLTAKLTAAEAKVAELEGVNKLTGIELEVQTAIDERQITPADKVWATKLATADADLWAECLASRPKGSAGPAAGTRVDGDGSPPVEGNPDDPAVRNLAIKQEQARLTTERGSPVTYEAAALSLEQQQKATRGGV